MRTLSGTELVCALALAASNVRIANLKNMLVNSMHRLAISTLHFRLCPDGPRIVVVSFAAFGQQFEFLHPRDVELHFHALADAQHPRAIKLPAIPAHRKDGRALLV